jgi:hypothetical protein
LAFSSNIIYLSIEARALLQMAKDGRVLNREPYKRKVDFETFLRMRGTDDLEQLEELREE